MVRVHNGKYTHAAGCICGSLRPNEPRKYTNLGYPLKLNTDPLCPLFLFLERGFGVHISFWGIAGHQVLDIEGEGRAAAVRAPLLRGGGDEAFHGT